MMQSILELVVSALLTTFVIVGFRQRFIPYWRNRVAKHSPSRHAFYKIRSLKSRKWRWAMQVSMWCLPYIDSEYIEWSKQKQKENLTKSIIALSQNRRNENFATHYPAYLSEYAELQFMDQAANEWKTHDSFLRELPRNPSELTKYVKRVHQVTDVEYIQGVNMFAYQQRIWRGFFERQDPERVARSFQYFLREWKMEPDMHALPAIGGCSETTHRIRYIVNDDGSVETSIVIQPRPYIRSESTFEKIERFPDGRRKPSALTKNTTKHPRNPGQHRLRVIS